MSFSYPLISLCPLLVIHPDIVFFGENLPVRFFTSMKMVSTWWCAFMSEENAMQHFAAINSYRHLYLPIRTSLAVIFSSSWGRLCRSNHSQVSSAGTADQVSYSWKLLLTTDTAAVIIWEYTAVKQPVRLSCRMKDSHLIPAVTLLKCLWGKVGSPTFWNLL